MLSARMRSPRAAYLALCLGEAERLSRDRPDDWKQAIDALKEFPKVVKIIFKAPQASATALQERARAAGLEPAK